MELLVELLTADVPLTKQDLRRRLRAYRAIDVDTTFESQFQRDKDSLREAGIVVELNDNGTYCVAPESFASSHITLDSVDAALVRLATSVWKTGEAELDTLNPKIAALSTGDAPKDSALDVNLEGAENVLRIFEAMKDRRLCTFEYRSDNGAFERTVEPWQLVVRGRALYLWGKDLDRQEPRLFRLSRCDSQVTFIGEPGDADPMPDGLEDPFESRFVAPQLLIREGAAPQIRRFVDESDVVRDGVWREAAGETAELGEWISRVLLNVEDVVVLEPQNLRDEVLHRLEAAAAWGGEPRG